MLARRVNDSMRSTRRIRSADQSASSATSRAYVTANARAKSMPGLGSRSLTTG